MKKDLIRLFIVTFALLLITFPAEAFLINFDDMTNGTLNPVIATPYGTVAVTGRISNTLGGSPIGDHTTGSGLFVRNADADNMVALDFSFPVSTGSIWGYAVPSTYYVRLYDDDGAVILNDAIEAPDDFTPEVWSYAYYEGGEGTFQRVEFRTSDRQGRFAFDDLEVHAIPEPTSVFLLGTGLACAGIIKRRQTN